MKHAVCAGSLCLVAALTSGCSSTSSSSDGSGVGSSLKNLILFGGAAPPPVSASTALEGPECPPVSIADGGATMRTLSSRSAEASAVASQISITDTARECNAAPNGGIVVKVGVQGRALLGPGGTAARFDTPVRFVLKQGNNIIASRVRRVATAVTANEPQSAFTVVEDGLVAPPGAGDFEIEVGLGNAGPPGGQPARRRSRS